jgi:hypothetical protein
MVGFFILLLEKKSLSLVQGSSLREEVADYHLYRLVPEFIGFPKDAKSS